MVNIYKHYDKVLNIIASCEDVNQLQVCVMWLKKLCEEDCFCMEIS